MKQMETLWAVVDEDFNIMVMLPGWGAFGVGVDCTTVYCLFFDTFSHSISLL